MYGIFGRQTRLGPIGKPQSKSWSLNCTIFAMPEDRDSERRESLHEELKAIEVWDEAYRHDSDHKWLETVAFQNRQRRRNEILIDLQTLGKG